jgi:nucleoid-associated protein EbfC
LLIDEVSSDGKLKVTVTANSNIKSISINDSLLSDRDELEDYLILTLKKALEKAKTINENELTSVA